MSVQSAREFLIRMETDQDLKDRLAAVPDKKARQKIVRAAGFDFTLAEYKQMVEELAAAASQELSAEELQGVAGGAGGKVSWCPFHGGSRCSNDHKG
ncbi:MAG: Nif11-like leader peptide family natural product precursor [Syntrophales bacterium]|nr:Nif11-like leader peptide family natural product precursor [Syntrophales bacterium]MDD5640202.1 Nif11-like leader peptide family natural product precursor [Syntrophales bacterium]